jgi:DNA-binding MarR family transcriptional regulator
MSAMHTARSHSQSTCSASGSSLPWFLLKASPEEHVDSANPRDLLNDLLGTAHLFVSAISGVMEHQLRDEVAGCQLTLSQLKILKLLGLTGAQSVGEVAAFLGVSNAAASIAVDRLVHRKLLRRAEALSDRRSAVLSLAAAGRALVKRYETARDRKLLAMFGNLEADEVRQVSMFLERLTKGVIHHSANPDDICLQCGIYLRKRCLVREAGRPDCQYQRRKTKRPLKDYGAQIKISTGGRPRVGPPG